MKRIGFGVVLGSALAVLAPAAFAASGHAPMSSDGKGLSAVESASGGKVSRSFSGRPGALKDFGAEFGGDEELAVLKAIEPSRSIGAPNEDRPRNRRVEIVNTEEFPASAVALVTFEGDDNIDGAEATRKRCTGWFINKDTVVTAGSCVYRPGDGWHDYLTYKIYPGRNGKTSPYGHCRATRLYTVTYWALEGRDDYDYGAIKLNCNIGNKTGWFGYFWKSGSLKGRRAIITGYPSDKKLTMWQSKGNVTVSQPRRVFYPNETVGMTGAPVYSKRGKCDPCAYAVNTYERDKDKRGPFRRYNHGTRITQEVFTNLNRWKRALK
ncbi:trypsin-like serine peptidase [Microbaculum marinum]|uniref:Serine protease n=1 Tax=Microbaculum marinum TaxID=1764581 RepID=A0AAW9RJ76_9HYPH